MEKDFLETKVIAIARGVPTSALENLASALYNGGIRFTEVTLNSPMALQSIDLLRKKYDDKMHIGAGTVTTLPEVKDAVAAGAKFIVTPNINKAVIEYCLNRNIMIIPGALTPTEIAKGIEYGCSYIKIFPIETMGPSYLEQIRAPFQNTKFIAVGGISDKNAAMYKKSGAFGLGIGGNLCKVPENGDYESISTYASNLLSVIK